jgi:predicted O-methyltransferase YrrM
VNNIVQSWLPALDEAKLKSGAKVADVGCGVGFSTVLMAQAFSKSQFVGDDFHAPSVEEANRHAVAHGLGDRLLDQEVGEGLGAQAGETKLTEVIRDGGFTRVRRATEGPFNMVLEARA